MKRLRLNGHAHCCFTPDGAVLLDLRSDRYSVIPEAESQTLALLLEDGTGASDAGVTEHAAHSVAAALLERGLASYDAGKSFAPPTVELTSTVLLDRVTGSPRVGAMHVLRFIKSCIAVHVALRSHSFQYAVERARRRKAAGTRCATHFDLERARTLVQIVRKIRPFVFSARKRCLYDSLVLADFLAQHALYPSMVFGVATKPFRAHCWVQHHGMAFNSDDEDITQFTPIMLV